MNDRQRFDELWTNFLEGELSPDRMPELQELLHDPQLLAEATDQYQLHRLLGWHGQSFTEEENKFLTTTMGYLPADQDQFVSDVEEIVSKTRSENELQTRTGVLPRTRMGLPTKVVAIAAILLLSCLLYFGWNSAKPKIEMVDLRGNIILTGDGGNIADNLVVGHRFVGGTLESLTPDAFCKLRFDDQTTVTISGKTLITLSQNGQKVVRLRRGKLSADVTPQPKDHPLLVYTEAAELKVLGTQFNVEANTEATNLVVNEGLVRLKRLTDGKQVEVPAHQSVMASLEDQNGLSPSQREAPLTVWQSDLRSDVVHGMWVSNLMMEGKSLKIAVRKGEITQDAAQAAFKKMASLDDAMGSVWATQSSAGSLIVLSPQRSSQPPILLNANTRLRIRGRTYSQVALQFGLSVGHPEGGFAGKYSTRVSAEELSALNKDEAIEIPISKFLDAMDPTGSPIGSELVDWWCIADSSSAKFEITDIEITDTPPEDKP
ncbi:MAG: FecR family protein [Mariniblastus sp.]|nr:FecR family protein [Mariniblastus sp.]